MKEEKFAIIDRSTCTVYVKRVVSNNNNEEEDFEDDRLLWNHLLTLFVDVDVRCAYLHDFNNNNNNNNNNPLDLYYRGWIKIKKNKK